MGKRIVSILCGALLVLCLGHVYALAAGSDDSREVSNTQVAETAESNQSKDGDNVGELKTDEATDGKKDVPDSEDTPSITSAVPGDVSNTSTPSEGEESAEDDTQIAGLVNYRAHVQSIGWQDWTKDGALSGTTGRALRVEALQIKLGSALSGAIE